ncbi:hypothetical protein BDW42DRAFT_167794 [Aspergillus taichungensis]|uniref:Uncharacterized protein n=1 Tax=Aspergillus taichungensis TaxID=482145 RepID=A0A2J5HX10_9EURO|nr:hypothetical protein BDW42DRAFT_167794 [Aspergillus taichungensis]
MLYSPPGHVCNSDRKTTQEKQKRQSCIVRIPCVVVWVYPDACHLSRELNVIVIVIVISWFASSVAGLTGWRMRYKCLYICYC